MKLQLIPNPNVYSRKCNLVSAGHTECLIYLIKEGANINILDIKAQTPLFVAVKNKHTGCIQALLEAGADPNGDLQNLATPLYLAARDGYTDGVEVSLDFCTYMNVLHSSS